MNAYRLDDIACALEQAWADSSTVPAPSQSEPSLTVADAYAIQDRIIDLRLEAGRRRAGWKMGLTSAVPPATPIVGTLLDDMILPSGSDLSMATMVAPMVEAELVVRIGETIDRAQTIVELERGPHEIGPGIEVIDYRTTGSEDAVDWIADNSTVAYAVVGAMVPVAEVRPAVVEASLSCDGRQLATGRGDQVMGNPLEAVAWLSQHLMERGRRMERGDVILTGSLTGHHRVVSADAVEFTADFGALGTVEIRFHP
jgi:2-oxo-3-hexenedioate decarboxylase